jgi:hypothetical protein
MGPITGLAPLAPTPNPSRRREGDEKGKLEGFAVTQFSATLPEIGAFAMKPSERAAKARIELEGAILDYLEAHPDGAINSQIARDLGLESDFGGRQKNYLSYSILGGLMTRGLVKRETIQGKKPFKLA